MLLPSVLILVWLAAASVGGPVFGKVSEVVSNDPTAYLPASADATKVQGQLGEFTKSDAIPAIVVFVGDQQLTTEQLTAIGDDLKVSTAAIGLAAAASPLLPSADGFAAQAFVGIPKDANVGKLVGSLSSELKSNTPAGVAVYVTGPAGLAADLSAGFAGIDGLLLGVALLAVFIILILVYRSLVLPFAVLATSVFALCAALFAVWWLAKLEVFALSGQTQGILFILVIGAATDYSLLYVARYREELRNTEDKWSASISALRGSFEPIVASGLTVIAGLMCLLLSDLRSNSALAPIASIGIVFAMLSALTFLPSMLFAFGRAAFWPRRPKYEPDVVASEEGLQGSGFWTRLALGLKRRPRSIWIVTTALLMLGALGVTQLNAVGVPQSDLVLGQSDARDGQAVLGEHFPAGSGSPVQVVVDEQELPAAVSVMQSSSGIESVTITTSDPFAGSQPGAPGSSSSAGSSKPQSSEATVVDGSVLVQGTLNAAPDSNDAAETVLELRRELESAAPSAAVGGVTAIAVDTNAASTSDRNKIIPLVLVVITLILMVLLRSILAPVILIATTVLSFGTALGVSALVFNGVFQFPGADPAVPLFGFIFLVALGIDYNIFLMTRVREETLKYGTRPGILRGLAITGGVITSAGLVLAATFAALGVIPILFLVQLAFIVSFGVLLDTFVVRTLLVPALTYDIGKKIWWPSKLAKEDEEQVSR